MNDFVANLFSLGGKVAVVTGASRGIGASLAKALGGAGASVIGLGRSAMPSQVLPGIVYQVCDVRNGDAFTTICEQVFRTHGRLDILVNAAGISLSANAQTDPFHIFEETLSVNLTAVYRCCEIASRYMKRNEGGAIVNVTSIGAALGFPGNPGYVAAKGGLAALTRALALDLAPQNIRVNNLAPGYIRTAMTEASYADPQRHASRQERMMIKRWGTPEDLAGAVIYLTSNASAYVTGTDLFVDGGWSAKGL